MRCQQDSNFYYDIYNENHHRIMRVIVIFVQNQVLLHSSNLVNYLVQGRVFNRISLDNRKIDNEITVTKGFEHLAKIKDVPNYHHQKPSRHPVIIDVIGVVFLIPVNCKVFRTKGTVFTVRLVSENLVRGRDRYLLLVMDCILSKRNLIKVVCDGVMALDIENVREKINYFIKLQNLVPHAMERLHGHCTDFPEVSTKLVEVINYPHVTELI